MEFQKYTIKEKKKKKEKEREKEKKKAKSQKLKKIKRIIVNIVKIYLGLSLVLLWLLCGQFIFGYFLGLAYISQDL